MTLITRRAALCGLASIPSILAPVALTARADERAPSALEDNLVGLEALIGRHAELLAAEASAYAAVPDVNPPRVRVQVGRQLTGYSDDGERGYTPIWAFTETQVEQYCYRSQEATSIWAQTPERAARHQQKWAEVKARKLAEFRALVEERNRLLEESGYTAAHEAAEKISEEVRACERALLSWNPTSLAEAARIAAWAVASTEDTYWLDANDFRKLLNSIASAGGAA